MKARPKGGARACVGNGLPKHEPLSFQPHKEELYSISTHSRTFQIEKWKCLLTYQKRQDIIADAEERRRTSQLFFPNVVFFPSPVTHPAPPLDAHVERLRSAPRSVRDVSSHPPEFDDVGLAAAAGFRARDGDPATDE